MKFSEFEEGINQGALHLDEDYWACDFRYLDVTQKPVRGMRPLRGRFNQYVLNHGYGSPETTYDFQSYGKSDKLLSSRISVKDGQYYNINYVHVFLNKEECFEFYKKQCLDVEAQASLVKYTAQMQAVIDDAQLRIACAQEELD